MTTTHLIDRFTWSSASRYRNALTVRYEPIQPIFLMVMARHLDRAVFIDAGANIGFYAVVVGAEPTVEEVHAFEPMPASAAQIRWNLQTNLPDKLTAVHEVALSNTQGQLEFAVVGPMAGDNGALADSVHDRSHISVSEVPCDRLDACVPIHGRGVAMKVDVEGHELSVLQGATETLTANHGFLQVEMHESDNLPDKIALLADLGWHLIVRIGPDHYFSNLPEYVEGGPSHMALLEECLDACRTIALTSPPGPARRRIAPGVHLEISRQKADAIKRRLLKVKRTKRPR